MAGSFQVPVVLVFAGNDPTGGAGLSADMAALASVGCHAAPVLTALTVQDTCDVKAIMPVSAGDVVAQARAVLEDVDVAAIKIGLTGSVEVIEALHTLLQDYRNLPVVLDPVLAAGGGTRLADEDMIDAINTLLVPLTTVLTPNSQEVHQLAPAGDSLDACAQELLERDCEYVLITGTHEKTPDVIHRLYGDFRLLDSRPWPRLDGTYHGSGCTLSSAIAGLLAQGETPIAAVWEAQEYTWKSLRQGFRIGMGQLIPDRYFWARQEGGQG